MKWNSKNKPKPILGDTKQKVKFALFPVKVGNQWLWLEKYIGIYEYKTFYYSEEVVVSSGLLTEKYYTKTSEGKAWRLVNKKLILPNLPTTD